MVALIVVAGLIVGAGILVTIWWGQRQAGRSLDSGYEACQQAAELEARKELVITDFGYYQTLDGDQIRGTLLFSSSREVVCDVERTGGGWKILDVTIV